MRLNVLHSVRMESKRDNDDIVPIWRDSCQFFRGIFQCVETDFARQLVAGTLVDVPFQPTNELVNRRKPRKGWKRGLTLLFVAGRHESVEVEVTDLNWA